jgi:hypothetical protein
MRYSYDVVVPKNTIASHPYKVNLRLDYGTLAQVIIHFRAGCHNRVFIILRDGLFQIVPASGGTALYADNQTIFIPMVYPLTSPPFELLLRAWSPGTLYDHTISLWLDLQEETGPGKPTLVDQLKHLLGLK